MSETLKPCPRCGIDPMTTTRMTEEAYDIIYADEPKEEREPRWKWVVLGISQMKNERDALRAEGASMRARKVQLPEPDGVFPGDAAGGGSHEWYCKESIVSAIRAAGIEVEP